MKTLHFDIFVFSDTDFHVMSLDVDILYLNLLWRNITTHKMFFSILKQNYGTIEILSLNWDLNVIACLTTWTQAKRLSCSQQNLSWMKLHRVYYGPIFICQVLAVIHKVSLCKRFSILLLATFGRLKTLLWKISALPMTNACYRLTKSSLEN